MVEFSVNDNLLQSPRSNKVLDPSQYGFLPDAMHLHLLTVMESLTKAYNSDHIYYAPFTEFAKAFDRVP